MKRKLFLIAVLFCFGVVLNAQNTFNKGDFAINANIGIGGGYDGYKMGLPPISVSGEYGIVDNLFDAKSSIGVGGYIGFATYKDTYDWHGYYKWESKITRMCFGARGIFHYQLVDNLDTYGGLMLGLYTNSYKWTWTYYEGYHATGNDKNKDNTVGLAFSLFVGARYYFTENFGVNAELGYGLTYFSLGATFKL